MATFLHYAAHSDFEEGIYVPFSTQKEAERQAASDLMNGCDPDFILGIFEAEYKLPKFGWTKAHLGNPDFFRLPHHDPEQRKPLLSKSQLLKACEKHAKDMIQEQIQAKENEMLEIHKALLEGRGDFKNSVPGNAYSVMSGGTATAGAVALAAATAKTIVLITASTANPPAIVELGISFDGVTASAVPVLVELVSGTAATAGTTTAQTPKQVRGWPASASQTAGAHTYTAEPTTQLVNRKWLITPNGGMFVIQSPLGREQTGIVTATTDAKTWSIRCTAPAIVNCHAYIEFEE